MKYARIDSNGKIVEIIEQVVNEIPLQKRFHSDYIAKLVRVADNVEVDQYVSKKGVISKRPSEAHKIDQSGDWVLDQEKDDEIKKAEARKAAFKRIQAFDLKSIKDESVKSLLSDMILMWRS